ncbi:uncharacterized protein LOC106170284 [Lingula anatina]|uniref:Uncharacterized protein LOC106170284 n=1 Tax=Lingula anatina TaxID=7574 RepID=A0A1S3J5L3_LINAN|nr:uncharacterized protein LOC106170284 [Lingula anatina]|eukprot:XP_013405546.1 uncharacterized protein LOC106170284 [Lingula anatina]
MGRLCGILLCLVSVVAICTASELAIREKRQIDVNAIRQRVERLMRTGNIPDAVVKALGSLDQVMQILSCLPTSCTGNCCTSPDFCPIPQLASDMVRNPRAKFTFCKNPWKIRIDLDADFRLSGIARLLKIKLNPIEIPIDNRESEGVLKMQSTTEVASAAVRLIGLRLAKAKLKFDFLLRYDCTKPQDNPLQRNRYNSMYDDGQPGPDGNKLFYKLNIKFEVLTKRFPCFCYKVKSSNTLVDKKKHFAEGPDSCKTPAVVPTPAICKSFDRNRVSSIFRRAFDALLKKMCP